MSVASASTHTSSSTATARNTTAGSGSNGLNIGAVVGGAVGGVVSICLTAIAITLMSRGRRRDGRRGTGLVSIFQEDTELDGGGMAVREALKTELPVTDMRDPSPVEMPQDNAQRSSATQHASNTDQDMSCMGSMNSEYVLFA